MTVSSHASRCRHIRTRHIDDELVVRAALRLLEMERAAVPTFDPITLAEAFLEEEEALAELAEAQATPDALG